MFDYELNLLDFVMVFSLKIDLFTCFLRFHNYQMLALSCLYYQMNFRDG